ncbi:MAG: plastocyanin/azurin family copper-binding protein [Acidobacteriota bacterium]
MLLMPSLSRFRSPLTLLAVGAAVALALSLPLASTLEATDWEVFAQPDNTFSPSELILEIGDRVTFTNAGGFHNVSADDGSFRCANGCDGDGMGGSGEAASNAWSFTLDFLRPGMVTYHCEPHQALGMVGELTIDGEAVFGDTFETGTSAGWTRVVGEAL